MDELPARSPDTLSPIAVDLVARASDAGELLDIDVQKLTGMAPLVAVSRLVGIEARSFAQPSPAQYDTDRRHRHCQALADLSSGHAQSSQSGDYRNAVFGCARRAAPGRGWSVHEPRLTLLTVTGEPLRCSPFADAGGGRRVPAHPPLLQNSLAEQKSAFARGLRVTVDLHPGSSLRLVASTPPANQGAPGEQRL
jgi:hypothetical protein